MAQAAALCMKSPEAFRTISEVAAVLDVPQHVLRFWETRFPHIKPIKRAGGRRFYRPEDVDLLRGIRVLLYFDGYTIKGVQKILREKGARFAADIGRNEARTLGIGRESGSTVPKDEGFDALATLARIHSDDARTLALDVDLRADLTSLLSELLALKTDLAAARSRFPA